MKTCSKCNVEQTEENSGFRKSGRQAGQLRCYCRDCERALHLEWSEKNPERKVELNRDWRKSNRDHINTKRKEWMSAPNRKIENALRGRFRVILARTETPKQESVISLIGCSVEQLREHLESLFRPGMSWENYGHLWEIDHKKPCKSFNFSKEADRAACFHYSNLQPLTVRENRQKGAHV